MEQRKKIVGRAAREEAARLRKKQEAFLGRVLVCGLFLAASFAAARLSPELGERLSSAIAGDQTTAAVTVMKEIGNEIEVRFFGKTEETSKPQMEETQEEQTKPEPSQEKLTPMIKNQLPPETSLPVSSQL